MDNPVTGSAQKHADSKVVTAALSELLIAREPALLVDEGKRREVKALIKKQRRDFIAAESKRIYEHVPVDLQRALIFAKEKMASSVFTTRPLKKYGFCFPNKRDFRDLIAMRYHREPEGLPSICSCGRRIHSITHRYASWVDSSI